MAAGDKYAGMLVDYLDEGRLRAALAVREQGDHVVVADASGNERRVGRDLVLVSYPDRRPTRETAKDALVALNQERTKLQAEIDLNLLWDILHDDPRGYTASTLAETFFGRSSAVEVAVMLDALLADRLFFVRRHMEFVPRDPDQVERLQTQYERIRLRSEGGQQTRRMLTAILEGGPPPPLEDAATLIKDLTKYLENPFARNRETDAMLDAVAGELTPAEAAYEILARLGAQPPGARFALIGGIRTAFSEAGQREALSVTPPSRPLGDAHWAVTIDDEETVEIDDALACEATPDGGMRVRVHIALVADWVAKSTAMDTDAAARGTTVYLPETTVRMLPDPISTASASLVAAVPRHVLTTDVQLAQSGEIVSYAIALEQIVVSRRLTYDEADLILASGDANGGSENTNFAVLGRLRDAAALLRERRLAAGARLIHRREPKITVMGDDIDIKVIDSASPSRELVAECMVLSNHIAARLAAERNVPMIYRVQPNVDDYMQRPRLSLYPGFHAGVGLDGYVQASSPIRRYVDLVLQRQLVSTVSGGAPAYDRDQLMAVLAAAEATEAEGRELERRAKRFWTLTYLQRRVADEPLEAILLRDGSSAELLDYAVRGTLRGAPNLPVNTRILVQPSRVDPLHGGLTLHYVQTVAAADEKAL